MKHRIIKLILAVAVICLGGQLSAQTVAKAKMKVLFVGYDPSKQMPESKRSYPGMMSKELFAKEYPVRMPAFKALLSQYFTEVATIDCRDWKPSDSDPYDVTIFDFKTKELEPTRQDTDANGRTTKYVSARYLPDNFSKPVVFIASTANEMGDRIGLKLDWLCLCLDADAHHMNLQHPIFKGPINKVSPTMVMKNTPDGIFHYSSGDTMPKQLPMWRVDKTGYLDGECRIGLVSRGSRFTEGPDAEVISSGVCQKDVTAVALGRHGNFFLWGFGSSPADMTDEAQKVFVNVVAYMKQFDGKMAITKKYNQTMATTDQVREIPKELTRAKYDDYVAMIKDFNTQNAKRKKELDEKKAAGKTLTSSEEESLMYIGREEAISTWEEFTTRIMGKYAATFGNDVTGFQKYINDNLDYVYCDAAAFYDYTIDSSVQKIGVSNHSIKLLDTCVKMMEDNNDPALALSVLKKYTAENFTTAKEWKKWIAKNRSKLYFSETNGYRFMINTYN
ncbi:hypothetical protein [Pinibacter aurantiacus]|uniref:Uncharacterized protein n=1 Tax=Pinibacter aurantiacus TaxID=2851599 RepID=A0A9E2SDF1_9BACT|nr:hypothetical protein [Pinibacter aurantiacus]MBV4359248.1 hypothetical protein [Pinibacter aurantiacus]